MPAKKTNVKIIAPKPSPTVAGALKNSQAYLDQAKKLSPLARVCRHEAESGQ